MNKAVQFVKEAYTELTKATWLSRKNVIQSTILVFLVVILVSAYVNAIDFGLSFLIGAILGGRNG
ncbi:MAG: preprotein translocase subunit SecE [Elusimicrobia bacterium]|nr:preprotein translocase subunit SecE [Elusimicrobiota bacterium]